LIKEDRGFIFESQSKSCLLKSVVNILLKYKDDDTYGVLVSA